MRRDTAQTGLLLPLLLALGCGGEVERRPPARIMRQRPASASPEERLRELKRALSLQKRPIPGKILRRGAQPWLILESQNAPLMPLRGMPPDAPCLSHPPKTKPDKVRWLLFVGKRPIALRLAPDSLSLWRWDESKRCLRSWSAPEISNPSPPMPPDAGELSLELAESAVQSDGPLKHLAVHKETLSYSLGPLPGEEDRGNPPAFLLDVGPRAFGLRDPKTSQLLFQHPRDQPLDAPASPDPVPTPASSSTAAPALAPAELALGIERGPLQGSWFFTVSRARRLQGRRTLYIERLYYREGQAPRMMQRRHSMQHKQGEAEHNEVARSRFFYFPNGRGPIVLTGWRDYELQRRQSCQQERCCNEEIVRQRMGLRWTLELPRGEPILLADFTMRQDAESERSCTP